MNSQTKLLVFGAHALDAELMAGGLISQVVSQGGKARIIHMTRGERGHPEKTETKFAEQLDAEREAAARTLGCQQCWLGQAAGDLPLNAEMIDLTFQQIRDYNPTHIVTHWSGSWHNRHVNTHLLVKNAVKKLLSRDESLFLDERSSLDESLSTEENVNLQHLLYGENCEDLQGFNPDLYVEVSLENFERWFAAVNKYELYRISLTARIESSIPYAAFYRSMARVRGLEVNAPLAQAFMCEKMVSNFAAGANSHLRLGLEVK